MHKKSVPDKKTGARNRRRSALPIHQAGLHQSKNTRSINELLLSKSGLRQVTAAIAAQQSWAEWLRGAVAAELAGHIVSAVPKNAELVVFADSAAWGTRLRYALAAMQSDIAARDSAIAHTTVRVQMRAAPTAEERD
jgi:Dna[CI] antecedent, DciA